MSISLCLAFVLSASLVKASLANASVSVYESVSSEVVFTVRGTGLRSLPVETKN